MLKVSQLENKNQFVIESENTTYFQSYESLIAIYYKDSKSLILGKHWDYSRTTLKHLYIYLRKYAYDVYATLSLEYSKNKKQTIENAIKCNLIAYDKTMA